MRASLRECTLFQSLWDLRAALSVCLSVRPSVRLFLSLSLSPCSSAAAAKRDLTTVPLCLRRTGCSSSAEIARRRSSTWNAVSAGETWERRAGGMGRQSVEKEPTSTMVGHQSVLREKGRSTGGCVCVIMCVCMCVYGGTCVCVSRNGGV